MAEIKAKFPETMTPKDTYLMLKNPAAIKMADAKNKTIHIDAYVIFEDTNISTGEVSRIVSIRSGSEVYVTNSKSFLREFELMAEAFGDDLPDIKITSGKSSKGRNYLVCEVVV